MESCMISRFNRILSAAVVSVTLAVAPAAFGQTTTDSMKKPDAMAKDTMSKPDSMTKPDTMSKDSMGKKDTMGKTDGMDKGSMSKDGMKK
jgi:pentapeptide MXKDX repeat protein